MERFHTKEYVDFLRRINPRNAKDFADDFERCIPFDCTLIRQSLFLAVWTTPFLMECSTTAVCIVVLRLVGFILLCITVLDAASRLNQGLNQICVNWSGGLHHAKKAEASGFCYMNDIVLAILELLKQLILSQHVFIHRVYQRVMYIDIDIHHGDGVEEAFYNTDRVMTVSFHKYGNYFPGSGSVDEVGVGKGKNYSVNVPLEDGMTDDKYQQIFDPVRAMIE